MKKTYVSWKGAFWDNIYIQEPVALQIMIEAYLRHTGDYSLFKEIAGDAMVWQWMQRWVTELKTNYTNKEGLMNERMWNNEIGWFENLYPDGTRQAIWTNQHSP